MLSFYISSKVAQALLQSIFKSFGNQFINLWEAEKMVALPNDAQ